MTDVWKEFTAIVAAIACVVLAKILDVADEGAWWPVSAFADAVGLSFAYYAGMIVEKALQATVSKNCMADASNPSGHANLSLRKLRHDADDSVKPYAGKLSLLDRLCAQRRLERYGFRR
jgi:hypothetical protein